MNDDIMTLAEVAAYLALSESTIIRRYREGLLPVAFPHPHAKRPAHLTFRRADVEHLAAHPPARKPHAPRKPRTPR